MSRKVTQLEKPEPVELTPQQQQVVLALVEGKSQREAAALADVAEETVSRWRNNSPEFVSALRLAQQQTWDSHLDSLRSLRRQAVQVLGELLEHRNADVRLKAARELVKVDIPEPTGDTCPERVEFEMQQNRGVSEYERLAALFN